MHEQNKKFTGNHRKTNLGAEEPKNGTKASIENFKDRLDFSEGRINNPEEGLFEIGQLEEQK